MAKQRILVLLVAALIGALSSTGAALAEGTQPVQTRDQAARCERLATRIQHVRAEIARLTALENRIQAAIDSGRLTGERLGQAHHLLAKIKNQKKDLEKRLEELLEIYAQRCS